MRLTLQQLEAHLWGAANILRGKTAGQDYKNYILSLMFYKRLCDQWECEADDAIAELERQQGRAFSEQEKAVFRKRGEHRFQIPDGSRWGDVKAASTNLGEVLTKAMRAVANANDELRGVFTVDWNQPAPDGSGKPLIPNEVVHALVQHFDEHDLSNRSVPSDVLGRACEYLIKQFADDAGAKAGEFFTPPARRGSWLLRPRVLQAQDLPALQPASQPLGQDRPVTCVLTGIREEHVFVVDDLSLVGENAHVHRPSVQIHAAVEAAAAGVESHGGLLCMGVDTLSLQRGLRGGLHKSQATAADGASPRR